MNKEHALKIFKNYTANYDSTNVRISLKIAHTYRVADLAERIAGDVLHEQQDCAGFAWLLGLLHDIGRFEQFTRYGTFKDILSVDHAELGADILFHEGLFDKFISGEESCEDFQTIRAVAETAVRLHNKLTIPSNLDLQTRIYTTILRDADKIDIFRVLTEPPYDRRDLKNLPVRDEVMRYVKGHRCVPRQARANNLEVLIAQCCMAFELEYPESRAIVAEQGYLKKLLDQDSELLTIVKTEIMKAWGNENINCVNKSL
ncbi:MAG: HD domain-containing protein [Synergistaceae bacterium]|nr:HD domain-containing protein [Synergistaceae bacterium]